MDKMLDEVQSGIGLLESKLDENFDKIDENFGETKGMITLLQSNQKIDNRRKQMALDELQESARKQNQMLASVMKAINELKKDQRTEEEGNIIPSTVTTSTTGTNLLSRFSMGCDDLSASASARTPLVSVPREDVPSMHSPEEKTLSISKKSTLQESNILQKQNNALQQEITVLTEQLASRSVEQDQTKKQLKAFTSLTKRKAADVVPKQTVQTVSEKKAEMKYYNRRKSGLMEQFQGRNLLESERVPTSRRPNTRSRARANKGWVITRWPEICCQGLTFLFEPSAVSLCGHFFVSQ